MRLPCLLLLCACTASAPPPPEAPTGPLRDAIAAWRASPDADNLYAVSLAAGEAAALPPGDRELDLLLGQALADVLIRPELAVERLEPLAADLAPAEADPWLDALLRTGQLERLATEAHRLHGRTLDPTQEGLLAAATQSRTHHEIDWRAAARIHDASALASRQVMYDRGALDRPVRSLPAAVEALYDTLPGWNIALAGTRSVAVNEAAAASVAGAIPASAGRRRVVDYADGSDRAAVLDVARALEANPRPRVVGLVIGAASPEGRTLVLCGEGRILEGKLWLTAGCGPERESAWLDAAELWMDLGQAGTVGQARATKVQARFSDAILAAE